MNGHLQLSISLKNHNEIRAAIDLLNSLLPHGQQDSEYIVPSTLVSGDPLKARFLVEFNTMELQNKDKTVPKWKIVRKMRQLGVKDKDIDDVIKSALKNGIIYERKTGQFAKP
jgi:hypothetical protein